MVRLGGSTSIAEPNPISQEIHILTRTKINKKIKLNAFA